MPGQHASPLTSADEIELWNRILDNQGKQFTTSGRASKPGIPFTYTISVNTDGMMGAEMCSESITRSTILLAHRRVRHMNGEIRGLTTAIPIFIFKGLGVIGDPLDGDRSRNVTTI